MTSTLGASDLHFTAESNFVTSGGYGPNQVSSVLGLGGALLLLVPVLWRVTRGETLLAVGAAGVLFSSSALTFSRGGLLSGIAALGLGGLFALRDPEYRARLVPLATLFVVAGALFVLPSLDRFTEGKFTERMNDRGMAGREVLMKSDLAIWERNPVMGVGPGMSKLARLENKRAMMAHTEFTRLVAEHGVLGIVALALLAWMGLVAVFSAPPGASRALAACFVAWATLSMLHAAMRIAAPAFFFGLAAAFGSVEGEWSEDAA
jgi:hypothetical protein